MATLIKQFARDESGAALVEYAVIFAVLLAGTISAFGLISIELDQIFTNITAALDAVSVLIF
ncbi:MAG: Flp family type IVb pilin [Alphaproteobacteria bacterium]|nr:Flp family type IVb pilin [Alphaproteobacteria bacterium]